MSKLPAYAIAGDLPLLLVLPLRARSSLLALLMAACRAPATRGSV